MSAESLLKKTALPTALRAGFPALRAGFPALRAGIRLAACVLAAGWLAAGCDSGSFPVGPSGSSLTVRAVPSTIEVRAAKDGLPVRVGTEIRVTTTLGRITEEVITTDADGLAFTTLVADGRLGTATVTARSGAVSGTKTVDIGTSVKAGFTCSGTMDDGDSELSDAEATVIFSYSSTGSAPNAWSWDFGDDKGTSSEKDPVYVYDDRGSYLVTLTVTDQGGSDSESKSVTVPGGSCSP